jgi:hypothetical protein
MATNAGFMQALVSSAPSPALGERAADFDWLIGSWSAIVRDYEDDGTYAESTGEWWFSWVLDGRALQDVWISPARAQAAGSYNRYGTTVRILERNAAVWRIVWINAATGKINELAGERLGNRIVLEGVDGEKRIRWSFVEITSTSFTWRGESQAENGEWQLGSEFFLVRSGESASARCDLGAFSDHLDVRVTEVRRARTFYDPFCAELGLRRVDTDSPQWVVYESADPAVPFLAITAGPEFTPCQTRVALRAGSNGDVDRIARAAKAAGATDFEEPHYCPEYSEGYYASFFSDPDGNRYEICHRRSACDRAGSAVTGP